MEKFDVIEVLGIRMLHADYRVDRRTIPKALFVYDLRGSDYDCGEAVYVEPFVLVNNAGTLISNKEIDFGTKTYRKIKNKMNFLGESETVEEYLKGGDKVD